jgi:hypothetical protein
MGCGGSKAPSGVDLKPGPTADLTQPRGHESVGSAQVLLEPKPSSEGTSDKGKSNYRRAGVSAEAGAAGMSSTYRKIVNEKSQDAREMIAKATASSTLFLGLSDEQREDVVSA